MHTQLPIWTGPAAALLVLALLLRGPVRRYRRRLALSLLGGLAAATAVVVWADRTRHAALAAHKAASAGNLTSAFILITIIVTAAFVVIGAARARKRQPRQLPDASPRQAVDAARSGSR